MPIATFRSFLGVAKETTPGTAVAATDFIAITADPKTADVYKKLDDKSYRGSAVETYAKIPAQRTGSFSVEGNVIASTIGYMLGSVLPDVTTTAIAAPSGLTLGTAAAGGTFAAGTYFWKVTAVTGTGETVGSNEVTRALTLNQQQPLTWTPVPGASGYNIYRGTVTNTETLVASVGPVAAYTDTGTATTGTTVPVAGSTATNAHAFACKNTGDGQPTSFTFSDFDGDNTRAFAGAKFSELAFKFSADGLLTYTSKAMSWASVVLSNPTPSFSTVLPIAAYTGVILIGGVKQLNVQSAEISIKRKAEYIQTVQGIQDPFSIFSGAVGVTGKFTTVMAASDPMLTKLGNSSSPGEVFAIAFTQGTTTLVFQMSNVVYDKVEPVRGKDYVELSATFEAVGNTTDVGASAGYSPCKVFLANNSAANTYQ